MIESEMPEKCELVIRPGLDFGGVEFSFANGSYKRGLFTPNMFADLDVLVIRVKGLEDFSNYTSYAVRDKVLHKKVFFINSGFEGLRIHNASAELPLLALTHDVPKESLN